MTAEIRILMNKIPNTQTHILTIPRRQALHFVSLMRQEDLLGPREHQHHALAARITNNNL